jgi:hypothetical protein
MSPQQVAQQLGNLPGSAFCASYGVGDAASDTCIDEL